MRTRRQFTELRQKAGLSLREAAKLVEVSERQAYRYESGECDPTRLAVRTLKEAAAKRARSRSEFRFIDLFSGIGGLRRAFDGIGGECVFSCEWDKDCRETYSQNYSVDHEFGEDVRDYASDPKRVPKHDVLLAGFPCQPFSLAGVSKKNALGHPHGFLCDTQGTLFFDLAQIIAHHKPAAFLLENVKNLESHDQGKTFATMINVLENELGYEVHTRVISSELWVPQKRQRIFIVGFRDASAFDFEKFKLPKGKRPKLRDILQSTADPKYTLTPHLWNYLKEYKKKHAAKGNGFGYGLFGPGDVARTLSARYYKDGSEILIDQPGGRPRRLTPRECSRLMGFDKGKQSDFKIEVSDTQAYRQFGNAVVVPVVRAVAALMKPHIVAALAPAREETKKKTGTDG